MDLRELIQSWIQWSRENIAAAGDIPPINCVNPRPPWLDSSSDAVSLLACEREKALASFVAESAPDPANIPVRFTALHVYSRLAGLFWEEYCDYVDDVECTHQADFGLDSLELEVVSREGEETEEYRLLQQKYEEVFSECWQRIRKFPEEAYNDLCLLVHALKTEDVPADWRYIRWEILNSYAIRDWDRALKLYKRAEEMEALDQTDLRFIRGQFNYLRVFGSAMEVPLETLQWGPKVLVPLADSEHALLLLLSGLRLSEYGAEVGGAERDILRDAACDLEKALGARRGVPSIYAPVLARCYFFTGHLEDSERIYKATLTTFGSIPQLKRWIYDSLERVAKLTDQPGKLIDILEARAQDFPGEKGIHARIAELKAARSDFEGVASSLRREGEIDPEIDRDWKISTLIALGETRDASGRLLSELKSDASRFQAIASVIQEYWPSFSTLSENARDEWVAGAILSHYLGDQPYRGVWLRKAAHSYANAVELELNMRVFSRFREGFLPENLEEIARREDEKDEESRTMRAYVLKEYPFSKRSLTLGEMAYIIAHCCDSKKTLFRVFSESFPRLVEKSEKINRVNAFRRGAAHGNVPEMAAEDIPGLCREIIDCIRQPTDLKTTPSTPLGYVTP